MKLTATIGPALLAGAVVFIPAGSASGQQAGRYGPLRDALLEREREAIDGAKEARLLAREFKGFLADPETETEEKPELRKIYLQEEARHRQLRGEALALRTASEELGTLPPEGELTLEILEEAYGGLGDLGQRGRAAWDNLLAERAAMIEELEKDYARELGRATEAHKELHTVERANRLLLDAIDSSRSDATDAEFEVALRLPRIKSAVELGFGITADAEDEDLEAQCTLLALVGYSKFFWDYYDGARTEMAEGELPRDAGRNIFGVSGEGVLLSDAIVDNRSNYYYLSEAAKANFNRRVRAIWGSEARAEVTWWDQKRAPGFRRASESLSSTTDRELLPNEHAFALLAAIDELIAEKQEAEEKLAGIHAHYREAIENAKDFGDRAALSSASFNALLWDRESEATVARFEAARRLLAEQLAACGEADWSPTPKAISTSVQSLQRIQKRVYAVVNVKKELTELLDL